MLSQPFVVAGVGEERNHLATTTRWRVNARIPLETVSMPQRRIEGERIPTLTPCHPTVHGFNEGKEETLSAASRGDKDNLFKRVY